MVKLFKISLIITALVNTCFAQTYKYDGANRLVQVSSNCSGTLYTYDANGNRKSISQISIVSTSSVTDERCGNDGKIVITPQNTNATYRYQWSNGQATAIIKNLSAGMYSVVITEPTSGFTCNQSFTVNPAFKDSINVQTQAVICIGGSNGNANVNIVTPNPQGTYSYHWSIDSDTSFTAKNSITNQTAGNYSVSIRNSYTGCVKVINFTIGQPPRFLTGIASTPPSCYKSNDATAQAQVIGSPDQYTFTWTGPSMGQSTQNVTGLSSGSYIVSCTQIATNCVLADTVIIDETPKFLSLTKTDSKCYQANNGTAKAIVINDPSQYSYIWTGMSIGTQTTQQISNLSPGLYKVTVTENFGNRCTESDSIAISEPNTIIQDVLVTPINCVGQNDGTAEAKVTGDPNQYTFTWYYSNGVYTLNQNGYQVNNLKQGTYLLTVTTIDGCTSSRQFSVTESTVNPNILYPNPTDGKVTVVICNLKTITTNYVIYSSAGQKLMGGTVTSNNGELTFDLTALLPGGYVIVIDGQKAAYKVVKL